MTNANRIPRPTSRPLDSNGLFTQEWRDYLIELAGGADIALIEAALEALRDRIIDLENGGSIKVVINGFGSIRVDGSFQTGAIQVSLYGDDPNAGPMFFYGNGPDGQRAFVRLYDGFEAGIGLEKTDSGYLVLGEINSTSELPPTGTMGTAYRVNENGGSSLYTWDGIAWVEDSAANGVVGFRLAPLADSGEGSLLAITRDQYGRVSGTRVATITGTLGEIDVADGDASAGLPTVSLADVANAGGGTLVRIARDAKGRVTGTSAPTTDDLPEGEENLYYTDTRADARINLQKGQPNGIAPLDSGGKLDGAYLPDLAITDTFVVASQAAMLALTAERGDVAIRTDVSKSFILSATPASTLANWKELLTPVSPVTSVFGRVGAVVAQTGDYTPAQVGAEPAVTAGTTAQYWRGDKTWRDFATDVRAAVLTGISFATNALVSATDTVLQAIGKLQAQLRYSLTIEGMKLSWDSTTGYTVGTGRCYAEDGTLIVFSSPISLSSLSLTANTWYHVYAADVSGTPTVINTTDAPVLYRGVARSRTGNTSQRYIGSIRTTTGGAIFNFQHLGDKVFYQEKLDVTPFRVLSNGAATVDTTIACSAIVPVSCRSIALRVFNLATSATGLFIHNGLGSNQMYTFNQGNQVFFDFPLNGSQELRYRFSGAPSGGGAYLDVVSYTLER